MRIKLLMPVLAAVLLQSCADRVEETGAAKATETVNTNVPVENTYTGAEPAAASPDINNEAAATAVTAVPCPSSSLVPRVPAASPLAGSMRPANSARFGLIPLSTTPIFTPRPVAPD